MVAKGVPPVADWYQRILGPCGCKLATVAVAPQTICVVCATVGALGLIISTIRIGEGHPPVGV